MRQPLNDSILYEKRAAFRCSQLTLLPILNRLREKCGFKRLSYKVQ